MKRMRWSIGIAAVLLAGGMECVGAEPVAATAFTAARSAFDAEHFADAARLYEAQIANGAASAEVWYNLGNARYKMGEYGQAALAYRRALRLHPRDADIRANLNQTRRQAGAVNEPDARWIRWVTEWTPAEWIRLGAAGYFGFFAGLSLMAFFPVFRRVGRPILILFLLLGLAGAGGWGLSRLSDRNPEWIIVAPDGTDARFAPLADASVHYHLSPASSVRRIGASGDWLQIRLGKNIGWIPNAAAQPVNP